MPTCLVLPGLGSSGPLHWQSLWEKEDAAFRRVEQRDWDRPACDEWCARLEDAVRESGPHTVLVAHSLACLLIVHWAHATRLSAQGALLVAPPDPYAITFPDDATGFVPVPAGALPFPSIVVASTDDPYADVEYARECARDWGSRYVELQGAGHINAESNLGAWAQGRELLRSLGSSEP